MTTTTPPVVFKCICTEAGPTACIMQTEPVSRTELTTMNTTTKETS